MKLRNQLVKLLIPLLPLFPPARFQPSAATQETLRTHVQEVVERFFSKKKRSHKEILGGRLRVFFRGGSVYTTFYAENRNNIKTICLFPYRESTLKFGIY